MRCYVQEISGGKPKAVTLEGTTDGRISPDGRSIVVRTSSGGLLLCPVDGGEPRAVKGAGPADVVIRWSADGRSLLVFHPDEIPSRIERLDPSTGVRTVLKTVGPTDPIGILHIGTLVLADDEKSHAYTCRRMLSHLFLVEGAR